jgi:hypothetical protein
MRKNERRRRMKKMAHHHHKSTQFFQICKKERPQSRDSEKKLNTII